MKSKYSNALSALIALPLLAATSLAADTDKDKNQDKPRPAQESKGGATTGKDATRPSADNGKEAPQPSTGKDASKPVSDSVKTDKDKPRPAQEGRGGATTGKDATKAPEKDADKKDK